MVGRRTALAFIQGGYFLGLSAFLIDPALLAGGGSTSEIAVVLSDWASWLLFIIVAIFFLSVVINFSQIGFGTVFSSPQMRTMAIEKLLTGLLLVALAASCQPLIQGLISIFIPNGEYSNLQNAAGIQQIVRGIVQFVIVFILSVTLSVLTLGGAWTLLRAQFAQKLGSPSGLSMALTGLAELVVVFIVILLSIPLSNFIIQQIFALAK